MERMLRARGIEVRSEPDRGGVMISLEGGSTVQAVSERVPGDVSAAAFWLVAGSIHPDAELTIRDVGVNPTRRAIIDTLRGMGARIEERSTGSSSENEPADGTGEPVADLVVRSSELRGIDLGPADVAAAIDEIPILCLAAAMAAGTTAIRGVGELRHKESDRVDGIASGLRALGVRVDVDGDDLRIHGDSHLVGTSTDSLGDHRLAMTFAVAGLVASGETTVHRPGSAAVSYPRFFADLGRVGA
jgi:3-phosphoshikimate 1-carboxyvinyltransferase